MVRPKKPVLPLKPVSHTVRVTYIYIYTSTAMWRSWGYQGVQLVFVLKRGKSDSKIAEKSYQKVTKDQLKKRPHF